MNPRPTSFYGDIIARIADTHPAVVAGLSVPSGELVDYKHIIWVDGKEGQISEAEFTEAVEYARSLSYREERANAYPSIGEQLDVLFHDGYEGWKAMIQAVKDEFPKPQ